MKRALAVAFACVLMHCCLFILQTHAQEVHAIKPITDDMLYKLTYPGPKDMDSIKNVKFIKNGMYTTVR